MKRQNQKILDEVVTKKRESKYLDFKVKFDPAQAKDWCEIIKDIVAMANSGGGWILIGVSDNGLPSGWDVTPVLTLDQAKITDKLAKYTGEQFDALSIQEADKNGHKIAALQVLGTSIPLVFIQPGTYDIGEGRQKTSFSKGTIYFRHGAKSEPGNTKDIRESIEREIERIRKSWLGNIRKVISAPPEYKTIMLPPEVKESKLPNAHPIRIVDDPDAPVYRKVWDESPYDSPQEIVVGILKSWKRDRTSYASESDMWTLYKHRESLELDKEKAECLLESAINRHTPFFFWAKLLPIGQLEDFICRVAKEGKYPAPNMILKLAHAIGGEIGTDLLDFAAENCNYSSVKSAASRLKMTVEKQNRIRRIYGAKAKSVQKQFQLRTPLKRG